MNAERLLVPIGIPGSLSRLILCGGTASSGRAACACCLCRLCHSVFPEDHNRSAPGKAFSVNALPAEPSRFYPAGVPPGTSPCVSAKVSSRRQGHGQLLAHTLCRNSGCSSTTARGQTPSLLASPPAALLVLHAAAARTRLVPAHPAPALDRPCGTRCRTLLFAHEQASGVNTQGPADLHFLHRK